jgi:hypothetical protein
MSSLDPLVQKDPRYVKAGKAAAKARWGGRRVLRLREMDPSLVSSFHALAADNEAAIAERERERQQARRYHGSTLGHLLVVIEAARAHQAEREAAERVSASSPDVEQ